MNKFVLRDTIFQPEVDGNGGERRTLQIAELLEQLKIECIDINRTIETTRLSRFYHALRFLAQNQCHFTPSLNKIPFLGRCCQIYDQTFADLPEVPRLLLWEATAWYIAPYFAKNHSMKIVALPHNLESLVPGTSNHFCDDRRTTSFENELRHLAMADAIICISREEQWLLKLHGLEADYLPYYPPKPILEQLLKIRKSRIQEQHQDRFLMLGSAINPTTLVGMIEQIEWLKRIRKKINFNVDIVGHYTERLKDYCDFGEFVLHGSVTSEKLQHLLREAKAILIHQIAGVGALTRIPEMLIAGIPVIASANACRSAHGYNGVYCYDNESELADLMVQNYEVPHLVEPPVFAARRFLNCIIQFS